MPSVDRLRGTLHGEYVAEVVDALVPPEDDEVSRPGSQALMAVASPSTSMGPGTEIYRLCLFESMVSKLLSHQAAIPRSPESIANRVLGVFNEVLKERGVWHSSDELIVQIKEALPPVLSALLVEKSIDELEREVLAHLDKCFMHVVGFFRQEDILPALKADIRSRLEAFRAIEKEQRTQGDVMACVLHIVLDFYKAVHHQDVIQLRKQPLRALPLKSVHLPTALSSAWRVGVGVASVYLSTMGGYGLARLHTARLGEGADYLHYPFAALVCALSVGVSGWIWRAKDELEMVGCYHGAPNVWEACRQLMQNKGSRWAPLFCLGAGLDVVLKVGGAAYLSSKPDYVEEYVDYLKDELLVCQEQVGARLERALQQADALEREAMIAVHTELIAAAEHATDFSTDRLGWYAVAFSYLPTEDFRFLDDAAAVAQVPTPDGVDLEVVGEWTMTPLGEDSWLVCNEAMGWVMGPASKGMNIRDLFWGEVLTVYPGRPQAQRIKAMDYFTSTTATKYFSYPANLRAGWLLPVREWHVQSSGYYDDMQAKLRGADLEVEFFDVYADVQTLLQRWQQDLLAKQEGDTQMRQQASVERTHALYAYHEQQFYEQVAPLYGVEAYMKRPLAIPVPQLSVLEEEACYFDLEGAPELSPFLFTPVHGLLGTSLVFLSYLDLLAYALVRRRYNSDTQLVQKRLGDLSDKLQGWIGVIHEHSNRGAMVSLYDEGRRPQQGRVSPPGIPFSSLQFFVRECLLESPDTKHALKDAVNRALGRISLPTLSYARVHRAAETLFEDPTVLEERLLHHPREPHRHPRHLIGELCGEDGFLDDHTAQKNFRQALQVNIAAIEQRRQRFHARRPYVEALLRRARRLQESLERDPTDPSVRVELGVLLTEMESLFGGGIYPPLHHEGLMRIAVELNGRASELDERFKLDRFSN